jgi:hypothetical protein
MQQAATCLFVGLLDFSSTLKMEALCSSETSVATQRTTWRHIPEDDILHLILSLNINRYEYKNSSGGGGGGGSSGSSSYW